MAYHAEVFSVSPAELVTIVVVALVVFGPRRLPELARKAGRLARELRDAAQDLRSDLEAEFDETLKPLEDTRRNVKSALDDVSGAASSLIDSNREASPRLQSTADATSTDPASDAAGESSSADGGPQAGGEADS